MAGCGPYDASVGLTYRSGTVLVAAQNNATPYRADMTASRALHRAGGRISRPALVDPGGFIGVDIFFVISGFLITGIILTELEAGRFSPLKFYARRVRRIFPALIVVLRATYLIGWFGVSLLIFLGYKEWSFYSPLPRAWELLAGGILADRLRTHPEGLKNGIARYPDLQALTGAALIAGATFGWSSDSLFNRFVLSSPPMVLLGLISYPLYLWHWPLLVYLSILRNGNPNFLEVWLAVIVAVLQSALERTIGRLVATGHRILLLGAQIDPGCFINVPRLQQGPLPHAAPTALSGDNEGRRRTGRRSDRSRAGQRRRQMA